MFFRHLGFDLKSAWYGVRSGGLASLVAVAALTVGIGATTLATTVAYSGLVRPLAFPDDSRLITLEKVWGPTGLVSGIKLDEFSAWRDGLAGAARLSAFTGERVTLRDGATAQDARAAYVVGDWFQMLGAQPLAGRLMDDSAPADEAVVSQAFASRGKAGDPAATPWTHLHHWRPSRHRRRRAAGVVQRRRRGRHLGAGARRQRAGGHRERRRENLSDGRQSRAWSVDRNGTRGGPDVAAVALARLAARELADARAALARSAPRRREAGAARVSGWFDAGVARRVRKRRDAARESRHRPRARVRGPRGPRGEPRTTPHCRHARDRDARRRRHGRWVVDRPGGVIVPSIPRGTRSAVSGDARVGQCDHHRRSVRRRMPDSDLRRRRR